MSLHITDNEIELAPTDVIVSTTDLKGTITYANDVFVKISGYSRKELIGQPHNILRHPQMPKAIFKYLWGELLEGRSLYAFVKNRTKNGDFYWVKVYAMPIKRDGEIIKLISYRQHINKYARGVANSLYELLVDYEKTHTPEESLKFFVNFLYERNLTYNDFIDRLSLEKNITNLDAMNINYTKFYNEHLINKAHIEHTKVAREENSSSCSFGKWIHSVKNEPYTRNRSWKRMNKAHEYYHHQLNDYIKRRDLDSSSAELEMLLNNVESSTHEIFKNLQDSIDKLD